MFPSYTSLPNFKYGRIYHCKYIDEDSHWTMQHMHGNKGSYPSPIDDMSMYNPIIDNKLFLTVVNFKFMLIYEIYLPKV